MHLITAKYVAKRVEEIKEDTPLFNEIQIVSTVDEKERMEKVRAYEEEHNVKIL